MSVLGFVIVSTIFMSQCARPDARGLRELTHLAPAAFFFFFLLSNPVRCLHGLRGNFRLIFCHRLGLDLVSFVPSCLWGVALEPLHCRVIRRFVDIRHWFRFRSDKFHRRS